MTSPLPGPAFVSALTASLERPLALSPDWSLWRLYAVRGAGFPVDLPLRFTDATLSACLAARHTAELAVEQARSAMRSYLLPRTAFDVAHAGRPYHRALQAVQKRRIVPALPAEDADGQLLAARYAAALQAFAVADDAYRLQFAQTDVVFTAAARELAAHADFRAAIAWQNPTALARLTRYFDTHPVDLVDGAARQYRRLVASYCQRYATKNEQIGFFGPVGWGLIDPAGPSLIAGDEVVRSLRPYFEYWAIGALADRAARLVPDALAPRLSPSVRLDERGLVLPDAVLPLDGMQREFLAALDGVRTVAALVERYAGSAGLGDPDAVRALLGQLVETDILDWRLPLPVTPEAHDDLDACLARLPGLAEFHADWRALDAARASLATLPFADVPARIAEVNARFEALAATQAQRFGGGVYAGRTPLYADAVRDIELTLPDAVFDALAPALVPVLASAQWFVQRLLEQYLAFVVATWRDLADGAPLPLATLWSALQEETDTALAIGDDVVEQLQAGWHSVLHIEPAAREQRFDVADVAARAREVFAPAGPVWSGARFQAPDLLLAARDLAALDGGDWCAVLGEIHPCTNLLMQTVTAKLCPVREAAIAATARVQSWPELVPAIARDARGHRTAYSLELPQDWTIEYGAHRARHNDERVLRLADLVVRDDGAGPVIATIDGARQWPLAQFFGPQLRSIGISRFKPLATGAHAPRISIGRLVLQRESWRVPRGELDCILLKDRAERLLGLRRLARRLGLPRHCFYRVPGELKPWYLDLESPVYCDLFADSVRKADDGSIAIGEMLPGPDQCWLRDGQGRRYTAELRMAAYSPP